MLVLVSMVVIVLDRVVLTGWIVSDSELLLDSCGSGKVLE